MGDDEEAGHGSSAFLRLPYGIAKERGIGTKGLTPSEVWARLKGVGVDPQAEIDKLSEGTMQRRNMYGEPVDKYPKETKRLAELTSKDNANSDSNNDTEIMRQQERQTYDEARIERVKVEYKGSVNAKLVEYVDDVKNGKNNKPFELTNPSIREIEVIKELTGVDTNGYSRVLTADTVRHVINRHGANGKADSSMSDIEDIARIEYVLNNFDSIELLPKNNKAFKNIDGSSSKSIIYKKRINGNYFVAEAVPNNKTKQIYIVTAYKTS